MLIGLAVGTMYGIARWYMATTAGKPLTFGASFVPAYAQSFGLDPKETMDAMINDLGVKRFRLVSYWDQIEPTQGVYDFSQLDWQFRKAEAAHAKVSLAIGLRQPRWPECHPPKWVDASAPSSQWYPELTQYMTAVINRYKDSPALDSYQLENEYFLKAFGICYDFERDRLVDEARLVKQLDPKHELIIARSNNALGLPLGKPTPDEFGVSIYKRVWDRTITHRYVEYPFPAWYYAFYAGAGKIITGKDLIIHELQAEPWPPNGQGIVDTPLAEQDKSMDAPRFTSRTQYAKGTGIKTIDLWGAEWWYYRKEKLHDDSVWQAAKDALRQTEADNAKLTNN